MNSENSKKTKITKSKTRVSKTKNIAKDEKEIKPAVNKKCTTCLFHKDTGEYLVLCRRYPPTTGFPVMNPDTWCGEYKPE
mgnify:FL=1